MARALQALGTPVSRALRVLDLEGKGTDYADNPRPLIRAGLIGVGLLVAAVLVWVAVAPLGGAAIAPGVVKVDTNRKVVQHQEGGIVGQILVRDGSKVKAGDALIVLKDVRVDATREAVQTQLDAELAKAARLSAEQSWAKSISYPAELRERRGDRRIVEIMQREESLFRERRGAYNSLVGLIHLQIAEAKAEIRARDSQLTADRTAAALQKEELVANEKLLRDGFISKTRILTLQRNLAEIEGRVGDSQAERSRAMQKVADLRLRAEELRSKMMQDAAAELRQTTTQTFDLRERLRPTQDAEERQRITAPISGEVVDLKVSTVGAVIGPRETILDIVPENADLIVEGRVKPEDISFVRVDAATDVRLTSYRQRMTPTVEGKVSYVSADRLVEKADNSSYYVVHVRVTPEALREAGGLQLQAGMPAEVFIKTSSRTALQYLLDPITGFLQRSMREH
ncbi:MAG: HlyD family type I secretion periplasmic adaptor subunit [Betaproteobacteria bacterium]|nr:HlyD family type I secretion periplasmic adaptor subunit [Betaproteobacteria bacterium]